jgi:hypothetical protein
MTVYKLVWPKTASASRLSKRLRGLEEDSFPLFYTGLGYFALICIGFVDNPQLNRRKTTHKKKNWTKNELGTMQPQLV